MFSQNDEVNDFQGKYILEMELLGLWHNQIQIQMPLPFP